MVPPVSDNLIVRICATEPPSPDISVRNVIDGSDRRIPTSDFIDKCRAASTEQGMPNLVLRQLFVTIS